MHEDRKLAQNENKTAPAETTTPPRFSRYRDVEMKRALEIGRGHLHLRLRLRLRLHQLPSFPGRTAEQPTRERVPYGRHAIAAQDPCTLADPGDDGGISDNCKDETQVLPLEKATPAAAVPVG